MFELEQAISEWRRDLRSSRIKGAEVLDELENHLRDELERQVDSGLDFQQAFETARARLGNAQALEVEFRKVRWTEISPQLKNALLTLIGVPNYTLATNMNATSCSQNVEPGWATYIKAGAFVAPSAVLWGFSCIFLMPKLKQICGNAGYALPGLLEAAIAVTSYGGLLALGLMLLCALLEWRSAKWPKYRRAVIGSGVFLVNAVILLVITMMVFSALVSAPALMHSAK